MKYRYWFNNEIVEVDIDPEWAEMLKEMDRKERNDNITARYKNFHYDSIDFEPSFMGKEEPELSDMFDGSPAFEYAVRQLPAREMDVLKRRALYDEPYPSIAKDYGMSATGVSDIYHANAPRFCKYYEDGQWIYSSENTPLPGNGKIQRITSKLTPKQIQEIRRLRFEFHTLKEIAEMLDVPCNRVLVCLMENPVDVTFCPTCGKPMQQSGRTQFRVFCSYRCYSKNYLKTGADGESKIASVKVRTFPDRKQQRILQFYKQAFVPFSRMVKILGMPLRTVQAFFNAKPLPYYVCICCGERIPGADNTNRIHRFCSRKCRSKYGREHPGAGDFVNEDFYTGGILPTPESLYLAMELKENGCPYHTISVRSGMAERELDALFRYDDKDEAVEETADSISLPKVITGTVRIANVHIREPVSLTGSAPLYTATILISKADPETVEGINSVLEFIMKSGKRKDGNLFYNRERVRLPMHDGDADALHPAFKDCYYINAASMVQPSVVDHKLYSVLENDMPVSGCQVRVSLTFFPYWINQKVYGIGCRLGNIQTVCLQEACTELPDICFDEFSAEYRLLNLTGDGPG